MNKIQCSNCGVVNWATSENCVRCKNKLEVNFDANLHSGYSTANRNLSSEELTNKNSVHASVYIGGLAIFVLIISYLFWVTILPASKSNVPADNAGFIPSQTSAFIPAPPPELNITAPKLESFTLYLQTEIKKNNGVSLSNPANSTTSLSGSADQWKQNEESRKKREDYLARNKSDFCKGTNPGFDDLKRCDKEKTRLNSEYDQVEVKEMYSSGKVVQCEPKLDGELKFDIGRYEKLAGVIFYIGKVSVNGFSGIQKDGQCAFAPTSGVLSAYFQLKWSDSPYAANGWQQSNSEELRKYSETQIESSREQNRKKTLR